MAPPKERRFRKECPVCKDLFGPLTSAKAARRVTCSPACAQARRVRSNRTRYIERLHRDNPAKTYAEIAREVGCTRSWVQKALARVKAET